MRKRWSFSAAAAAATVAVCFAVPASAAGPTRAELMGAVQIDPRIPRSPTSRRTTAATARAACGSRSSRSRTAAVTRRCSRTHRAVSRRRGR